MLHLRTLGTLSVEGETSGGCEAVLARPKAVGLLLYLALARPRGFHRRSALVALFWPEMDTDHARHALRQSLYILRQGLGAEVVRCRGVEEMGVNGSEVWCDVDAMDTALAVGNDAEALALYRGELLPAFYVPGAPDFERWLDPERERLRSAAAGAAWRLAGAAEAAADADAALRYAREAVRLSPGDEGALRRLIKLHGRLGDHAGAARAYSVFARELRREFGVDPASETELLMRELLWQPRALASAMIPATPRPL